MNGNLYLVRHCQSTGQEPKAPLTKLGQSHATALVDLLGSRCVNRIISSPFVRAYQSITPLSEYLDVPIEIDNRLVERVLSPVPLENWKDKLAETFEDLNLYFRGGESSLTAMERGMSVVHDVSTDPKTSVVIVTHGILMTLILKYFDSRFGYSDWLNMLIPDVYHISCDEGSTQIKRLKRLSSITI